MVFLLKNSKNYIYKEIAPLIEEYFPNYEIFYNDFILKFIGKDGNWKIDMHPIFEEIGMADYGVIKSLNYIQRSKKTVRVGDPNQTFKNIYFHFGLVLESLEHMARHILRLKRLLRKFDLDSKLAMSDKKICNKIKNWIKKEYKIQLEKFIDTGRPFQLPIRNPYLLKLMIQDTELIRNYNKFSQSIREYRNIFIHNPSVDIFMVKEERTIKHFSPKKNKAKKYPLWNDMRTKYLFKKDDFINPKSLIEEDLLELLKLLNDIWKEYHKHMKEIFQQNDIASLLENFNREKVFFKVKKGQKGRQINGTTTQH